MSQLGQEFTYEYVSWRYGPHSGAKGLVLLEENGRPTHFLVLLGEKFATGKREADCVGGFIDIGVDGFKNILQIIKKESQEELGIEKIELSRELIVLGALCLDAGMTNNRPNIFIEHIDASAATQLGKSRNNGDPYELQANVNIYSIDQLPQVVASIQDAYFLACVAKGWAKGYLPISQ